MLDLDDELMERYRAGDEDAFTLLVRRYQQPLINFIARFINDRDSAEDLAQETFIRIFKAAQRYEPGQAHFKTWMYHIAKNLCKNEIRNRDRRNRYKVDSVVSSGTDSSGDMEEIDLIANAPANLDFQPEVALERKELSNAIQKAIAELPEQYRLPLVLRDLQGLSYDEISEVLKLRSGTTKSRINRARLMLKDKLTPFI
jgi:RNA polymerase sigma-70 factor (ECF subfamily)